MRPGAEEVLPVHVKAGFALGDHTVNIQLATVSLFFLFFLTNIAGLPPSQAGLVLLAGRAFDAFTDPIMGRISDRTRWRLGRRRPYFLIGAVPFGVTFALLWSDSGVQGEAAIFLFYTAVYVLNTLCSTVLAVPYMALLPELALGYHERTSMNTFRSVGVVLAILAAAVGMPRLVDAFGGGAPGYAGAGWVFGIWVALPWLAVYAVTWERREFQKSSGIGFAAGARRLVQHRSYRILSALFLSSRISVDVSGAMLIFYFTYWVGRPEDFPIALALLLAGVLVSLPFWLRLARRADKRVIFIAGALTWSAMLVGILLVQPDQPRWVVFAFCGLSGVGYGVADLMPWSMLGDVIDEDELATGERRDGMYAGFFTFLRKLGGAMGVALAGFGLELSGFERGVDAQGETAILAVRLLTSLGPILFLLLAAWIALRFPLTRRRHAEIVNQLAVRRVASES
ncbi:MAG: glycoside-pentoside-hexuronide (GPH):cation symporter [Myxococcales bacterium]|nr:glycoside-pentoside-hexuronide (GPH):cation symporter [Myxococcales bacterium]